MTWQQHRKRETSFRSSCVMALFSLKRSATPPQQRPCSNTPPDALLPQVTGLTVLSQLMFLDVSHNGIQHLDASQLPPSLCFLKVRPVQHEAGQ